MNLAKDFEKLTLLSLGAYFFFSQHAYFSYTFSQSKYIQNIFSNLVCIKRLAVLNYVCFLSDTIQ